MWNLAKSKHRQSQMQMSRNKLHLQRLSSYLKSIFGKLDPLLGQYLNMYLSGVFGLSTIMFFVGYLCDPKYVMALLGLMFSLQLAYYKYKLAKDPDFKVPSCKCSTSSVVDMKKVIAYDMPISLATVGIVRYTGVLFSLYMNWSVPFFAFISALSAIPFAYIMIYKIKALCSLCINIHVINLLLWLW